MESFIGWIGGKRQLRKEILSHFPKEGVGRYIEVFGGAGWVLFAKEQHPGQLEVFNDLNGDLINLFRRVKYHCEALQAEYDGLLHSRELFFDYIEQLVAPGLTDLQRAVRFLYVIKHSFGNNQRTFKTEDKNDERLIAYLPKVRERLKNVVIEKLDFEHLIKTYDRADAIFYLDPPYVGTEKIYKTPFTMKDHKRLAAVLEKVKGRFILSYGDEPIIRELYSWCNIYSISRQNYLAGTPRNKSFPEVIITNY